MENTQYGSLDDRSEAYIWFYRQRTDCKQISVPSAVQRSVECHFMCRQYFWALLVNIFHSVSGLIMASTIITERHTGWTRRILCCDIVMLGHLAFSLVKKNMFGTWHASLTTVFYWNIFSISNKIGIKVLYKTIHYIFLVSKLNIFKVIHNKEFQRFEQLWPESRPTESRSSLSKKKNWKQSSPPFLFFYQVFPASISSDSHKVHSSSTLMDHAWNTNLNNIMYWFNSKNLLEQDGWPGSHRSRTGIVRGHTCSSHRVLQIP
jgi:hypothetical protein